MFNWQIVDRVECIQHKFVGVYIFTHVVKNNSECRERFCTRYHNRTLKHMYYKVMVILTNM